MLIPKKLEIEDKKIFDEYYNISKYENSEANFTNMFIWKDAYDIRYVVVDGFFVLMAKNANNEHFHHFPAGKGNIKNVLLKMREYYNEKGVDYSIKPLTPEMKSKMEVECPDMFLFQRKRDYDDYVYNVSDLIELPGKKYHAKKNHFNNFIKNYSYTYNRITSDTKDICKNKILKWLNEKEGDNSAEITSIALMFDNYDKLDVSGAYLEVDGEIAAITVGEIHQNSVLIHIEKADTKYKGAYATINRLFLRNEFADRKYVNREEDMGIEGLRKAKLSYYPAYMIEKYTAYPEK